MLLSICNPINVLQGTNKLKKKIDKFILENALFEGISFFTKQAEIPVIMITFMPPFYVAVIGKNR